jgi:hypothetical protein
MSFRVIRIVSIIRGILISDPIKMGYLRTTCDDVFQLFLHLLNIFIILISDLNILFICLYSVLVIFIPVPIFLVF